MPTHKVTALDRMVGTKEMLTITRDIDDKSVSPLVEQVENTQGREIKITIMSRGGFVNSARRLPGCAISEWDA